MTKRQDRDAIYVKRQFDTEIIVLCMRRYITYCLSYRDLVAMMAERGVIISHTTIMRWVIRYVPEFEKRWNRFARQIGSSWRVDENYISIKGKWHYLYRAVDKQGRSIDFMLRPDRGIAAAPGVLSEGACLASGSSSAQGHTRWPCTKPPGVAPL